MAHRLAIALFAISVLFICLILSGAHPQERTAAFPVLIEKKDPPAPAPKPKPRRQKKSDLALR